MRIKHLGNKRVLWLFVGITVWAATRVEADLFVSFDLNNASLTYTQSSSNLMIRETGGSGFDIKVEDDVSGQVLDTARIQNYSGTIPGYGFVNYDGFDFMLDLQLIQVGTDNWKAVGALGFTDKNTAWNAVEAVFTSTEVSIVQNGTTVLYISGVLSTLPGADSVLVNHGDPWIYTGDQAIAGAGDADSMAGQVTMPNSLSYDNGGLFTLKFGVGTSSLDTLFSTNRTFQGGEVKGAIVPAPAAVLLGAIGFSLAGKAKRRWL